jgi:tRNA uridine 5-carboxymethylaminomethyl modification enzyme
MSCNPAIGGLGKGHIVKEIDALGGAMALAADHAGIQFRTLNRSKGPAVRATRAQTDMALYSLYMRQLIKHQENLTAVQGEVTEISVKGSLFHVKLDGDLEFVAKTVVVTAGTFLKGLMHTGLESRPGGRLGDRSSVHLSDSLRSLGFELGRLKTGTCPRLDGRSIDFTALAAQLGDTPAPMFSFLSRTPELPQRPCHITYTSDQTHRLVRSGLDRSPLYTGIIKGRGPRYCPSIEDKVVRFPERDRHQIFIEPQGLETNEYYPNGISTSLPEDIQIAVVRSIKGLEQASILKFGYAVEYDFIHPTQLTPFLMSKRLGGLFFAGQINGTSGYEEAAAQGLVAGVNASLLVKGLDPLILRREQSYIGVMIDDLVTKGTSEPYRMFTSRVEHRMLLREDNADARLTPLGHSIGLVTSERWAAYTEKSKEIKNALSALKKTRIKVGVQQIPAYDALKRPGIDYATLSNLGDLPVLAGGIASDVEIMVKFEGYIVREQERVDKLSKMSGKSIPYDIDYSLVPGLTSEAVEKLSAIRPLTLGHAARIPGITPASISMIVVFLGSRKLREKAGKQQLKRTEPFDITE